MSEYGFLTTPIGKIEIDKVLVYYDGIRIFIGKKEAENYLAFLVAETEEYDQWFFVPVSEERISNVLNGTLSIRQAIVGSEKGFVYDVYLAVKEDKQAYFNEIKTQDILEDCLPENNSYIKV